MTCNSSARQLKRRKGPVKGRVMAAADEEKGDQCHGRGLHFLLGEPLLLAAPPREAVAAPAPLSIERRPSTAPPPRETKSGITTLTLCGSTFPGSRRRGEGAKTKRSERRGKRPKGKTRDCRSCTGSRRKWPKRRRCLARVPWPLCKSDCRRPTPNFCWRRNNWTEKPYTHNLLLHTTKWYCTSENLPNPYKMQMIRLSCLCQ